MPPKYSNAKDYGGQVSFKLPHSIPWFYYCHSQIIMQLQKNLTWDFPLYVVTTIYE